MKYVKSECHTCSVCVTCHVETSMKPILAGNKYMNGLCARKQSCFHPKSHHTIQLHSKGSFALNQQTKNQQKTNPNSKHSKYSNMSIHISPLCTVKQHGNIMHVPRNAQNKNLTDTYKYGLIAAAQQNQQLAVSKHHLQADMQDINQTASRQIPKHTQLKRTKTRI